MSSTDACVVSLCHRSNPRVCPVALWASRSLRSSVMSGQWSGTLKNFLCLVQVGCQGCDLFLRILLRSSPHTSDDCPLPFWLRKVNPYKERLFSFWKQSDVLQIAEAAGFGLTRFSLAREGILESRLRVIEGS